MKKEIAKIETGRAFASKELTKATTRIEKLNDNIRANLYEIAFIISDVKNNKLYEGEYENIGEWAKECFGYEKSMTYNLAKIGNDYTVPVINEKGKTIGYKSNLVSEGNDYTTTQITKMLPAGHDIAQELHNSGAISPSMSVREIETAIKTATAPESVEDETDITDDIETENAEEIDAMNNNPFIYIHREVILSLIGLLAPGVLDNYPDLVNDLTDALGEF